MTTDIVTLNPDTDVLQAIHILLRHNISGAPVVNSQDQLIGMLTEKDCMKAALDAAFNQQSAGTVSDFMVTDVVTVSAEEPVVTTFRRFYEDGYLRYPVLDGTGLVGVISRSDVMRFIGHFWKVSWDSVEM